MSVTFRVDANPESDADFFYDIINAPTLNVLLFSIKLFFQWQLSIITFTLNYPPIRNNLTSASLLSMLIETDYLNYPPIRNNLSSASLPLSCAGAILKILNSI